MKKHFYLFLICMLYCFGLFSQRTTVQVSNTWRKSFVKRGYYNWTVFLKADTAVLNSIQYVEYLLHSTFKDPLQRVESSKRNPTFSYGASGWGEFKIKVKVVYKSPARKPELLEYWLKLGR